MTEFNNLENLNYVVVEGIRMLVSERDYKKEYKEYHGTSEQKQRRAQRNAARKKLGLRKGDPREAGHQGANRKGPLGDKVKAESFKLNRSKQPKRNGSQD